MGDWALQTAAFSETTTPVEITPGTINVKTGYSQLIASTAADTSQIFVMLDYHDLGSNLTHFLVDIAIGAAASIYGIAAGTRHPAYVEAGNHCA